MGRISRSIAERILIEHRFQYRLQGLLHHCLCDSIRDRRHSENTRAPRFLRDWHGFHGWWKIAPGAQPVPDSIEVVLQVVLEEFKRLAIDSCGTSFGLHLQVCLPCQLLRNLKWLCYFQGLLLPSSWPLVCSRVTKPLRSAAITAASSLLRACLPLGNASILSASQVLCLCLSLSIVAPGSRSST